MRKVLLAVAIVFVITASADSRSLLNTQELTWISGIGKECQSVCTSPLVFSSPSGTNPPSYSCRIDLEGGAYAAGFQTKTGQCTASSNGQAVTSSNFDCGCLASTALPGLDTPTGGSCSSACSKSLLGTSGAALTNGIGSVCMPTSEMGISNHFGTTTGGQCTYVNAENSAISSAAFSCVCSFAQSDATAG